VPAPEKLTIDTPEQIPLEFPLAGVGSRFLALAFDSVLQVAAFVAVLVIAFVAARLASLSIPVSGASGTWAMAAVIAGGFLIYNGYFAFFESLWSGQTPGKRLVKLRVIDTSGRPLTVYAALLRNLLRIVDQLPGIYAIGILCIVFTRRNQRLGDLAARTVVVHERLESGVRSATASASPRRHGAHRLTPEEIVVIEGFLRRREDLGAWTRLDTGRKIATRMAARLEIEMTRDGEERLLEELAAEYRSGGSYR
jgi:uncharacterized RDD family membrane protein YckC